MEGKKTELSDTCNESLRLEECERFVTFLAREGVRVGPWVPLGAAPSPPPPSYTQSLFISTPTFDNGTACLRSQLPGVVLGVLGGPNAGTMCWSHLSITV